jgi:hypothetical protein
MVEDDLPHQTIAVGMHAGGGDAQNYVARHNRLAIE